MSYTDSSWWRLNRIPSRRRLRLSDPSAAQQPATVSTCNRRRCPGLLALPLLLALGSARCLGDSIIDTHEMPLREQLSVEALPADFYTFDRDEYWREPNDTYWLQFSNWVLGNQRRNAELVRKFGEWADRTLSGSGQVLPANESYLRLGFVAASEYGDALQFKPEARFRLDIPTVEEKLRLIVESESDELIPLQERRRSRQLSADERSDTDATGALRLLSQIGDAINLSNDVGARLRFPTDAFWRASARKNWELDAEWGLILNQRFYYFHRRGWGERTWLGLTRSFDSGWHLLSATELEWVHRDREFVMSQTLNTYKELNNRASVNPRIGVVGESQPGWRTTSYFADITYRYRLYHNWLYGEIIPAIEYPRDKSFKDQASIVVRLEMYFSGNLDR